MAYEDDPKFIPRRVPLARVAHSLKRLAERFAKEGLRYIREAEYNDDDPETYKYSVFFANMQGAVETARDCVEYFPEDDK